MVRENVVKFLKQIGEANLANAKEFSAIIRMSEHALGLSEHEISCLLDISIPTVVRWKIDRNIPHEFMRKGLVDILEARARKSLFKR